MKKSDLTKHLTTYRHKKGLSITPDYELMKWTKLELNMLHKQLHDTEGDWDHE